MSENPEPNIPLLRKCVEWVEEQASRPLEDREWDQAEWRVGPEKRWHRLPSGDVLRDSALRPVRLQDVNPSCGTAYCVAGYVCESSGLPWRGLTSLALLDGSWTAAGDAAQQILGLSNQQAHSLFDACNTAEDIRRIAEDAAGERL